MLVPLPDLDNCVDSEAVEEEGNQASHCENNIELLLADAFSTVQNNDEYFNEHGAKVRPEEAVECLDASFDCFGSFESFQQICGREIVIPWYGAVVPLQVSLLIHVVHVSAPVLGVIFLVLAPAPEVLVLFRKPILFQ